MMRIGFLMDPLETVREHHDSTFALMLECQRRGHELIELGQSEIYFRGDRAHGRMRTVRVQREAGNHFRVLHDAYAALSTLHVIFLRKDPPVDAEFLHATQLLAVARGPLLVNEPAGLQAANEKLFALRFPELMPATMVSRDLKLLRAFVAEQGGDAVVKPIDGFGGLGIFRLCTGDPNFEPILETATDLGRRAIVVQRYLPEVTKGDKRVIVLDGVPIGAVLRVPQVGELRANMAVGGRAVKAEVDARDHEICARLRPELQRLGLHLVGLDVIGRWLTEVNVTSPTGLVEIDALSGISLERQIVDFIELRVAATVSI
jgi:glutathione synthase